jgi:UDP-glucuronate 4-epimerase
MYIITGCAGFIGFHVSLFLLKKKIKVTGIDSLNEYYSPILKKKRLEILKKNQLFTFHKIDLCDKKKLNKVFGIVNDYKLIHLAAQPGVIYSFKNPKSYLKNNVQATRNLINLILNKNVSNFIFVSSSSVYGNQIRYPIKETAKLKYLNYYAKTKIICENLIKKKLINNESVKIVRPFTVYGPYGRPDMLILKFLNLLRNNKTIDIYNFGNHVRDFTYVEDVAKVIYKLSNIQNKKIQIFNICASKPILIKKIVKYFEKCFKKKININYKPKRRGEMEITFGSNLKLKKFLKIKKFTSISDGLNKTIKWYNNFAEKKLLDLHK